MGWVEDDGRRDGDIKEGDQGSAYGVLDEKRIGVTGRKRRRLWVSVSERDIRVGGLS